MTPQSAADSRFGMACQELSAIMSRPLNRTAIAVLLGLCLFTSDYDSTTASRLLADYESGYGITYVAWANSAGTFSSSGPDITSSGTYMRIDGPRVWIEIAVQSGIVVQGQTHYHMMFRDKTYDYYNQLGT